MGRAAAFKVKLEAYGTLVDLTMLPTTKCSCWEYGYPDKDCAICGGSGYVTPGVVVTVKAFVFPLSPTELTNEVGTVKMGKGTAYFSPDLDLYEYENVVWDGVRYAISNRNRELIGEEVIYRDCNLDRID